MHDIAILGGTAAGYAAAYRLASSGCDVVVLETPCQATECPLGEWVPSELLALKHLPKTLAKDAGAKAFRSVIYHSKDLSQQCEHNARSSLGYLVPAGGLVSALSDAALKAGATRHKSATPVAIHLLEDSVELQDIRRIRARLLLVAQNSPDHVLNTLAISAVGVAASTILAAALDLPLPASRAGETTCQLHVIQPRRRGELAMFFPAGKMLHVRILRNADSESQHAADLSELVAGLQEAGLIPAKLPLQKARGALWQPPAGVALDMETHVAKRCLLVGSAGGFADCITGATPATTIESALLACEVAIKAMAASNPQETLTEFKHSWRDSMADRLRPPNTSLAMLMPLLFVNRRIVPKFTQALLQGQSI